MKLAAIAKLIKADEYCKLYKVFYNDGQSCDLYIGTKTAIFPLTDFPKAQNERELAALLGIGEKEWNDIHFESDCPDDIRHIEGMNLDDEIGDKEIEEIMKNPPAECRGMENKILWSISSREDGGIEVWPGSKGCITLRSETEAEWLCERIIRSFRQNQSRL